MGCYFTKKELYEEISCIKNELNITSVQYPLNMITFCQNAERVRLEFVPFRTRGLQGMLYMNPDESKDDIIFLNSKQTPQEQNFYCSHEVIHSIEHRNEGKTSFNCFEKVKKQQDKFLEWQANEGSAELLVPYRLLLPKIKEDVTAISSYTSLFGLRSKWAEDFFVTDQVIKMRLENLKYEIHQYLSGISLNKIEILSNIQQEKRGIHILSLNDLEERAWRQGFKKMRNKAHLIS